MYRSRSLVPKRLTRAGEAATGSINPTEEDTMKTQLSRSTTKSSLDRAQHALVRKTLKRCKRNCCPTDHDGGKKLNMESISDTSIAAWPPALGGGPACSWLGFDTTRNTIGVSAEELFKS